MEFNPRATRRAATRKTSGACPSGLRDGPEPGVTLEARACQQMSKAENRATTSCELAANICRRRLASFVLAASIERRAGGNLAERRNESRCGKRSASTGPEPCSSLCPLAVPNLRGCCRRKRQRRQLDSWPTARSPAVECCSSSAPWCPDGRGGSPHETRCFGAAGVCLTPPWASWRRLGIAAHRYTR